MIGIFKRLIAWLLEKVANKISEPPKVEQEGYFEKPSEETLQQEIKNILLNTAASLRKKKGEDTSETSTEDGEDSIDDLVGGDFADKSKEEEVKLSFLEKMTATLKSCKDKIFEIPRWVKLVAIATLPVCIMYIIFYIFLVTPPATNSEDIFRYKKGKPLVRIGYVKEWPTSTVITSLISEAMDTNLNVDITAKGISQNTLTDLWQMMFTNRADITPSVWLPDTHAAFVLDAGDSIVDLGAWLTGARLGLVVPEYMNVNSIEDLAEYSDGGVIYGIDPDSKLHHMTERAIEIYGLANYRVIGKSDKYMVSKLEEALKNKRPIVVAAWTPHWMFGEWKVKMLSDPLEVFGRSEDIHIFASADFYNNFPDICDFLSKIKLDLKGLSDLMASARRLNSAATASNKWMLSNKEEVLKWVEDSNNE